MLIGGYFMLDGMRVIDFSQYIPGSYASQRLGEMGAEIIKVEPVTGNPIRSFGREVGAEGVIFTSYNYGKKSISLNLKEVDGQKIALELIMASDVVIESFRPEIMKSFGLAYENIKGVKKDIIYLSLTGYGQSGSFSNYGSHDLNYLALSGVLSQFKDENDKPILPKITFADIIGGMAASEQVVSALFKRERTGEGSYIDLSLMDQIYSLIKTSAYTEEITGKDNIISQLNGNLISYNIYETKDGRFVSLAALEYKFWYNFCEAMEKPGWLSAHLDTITVNTIIYNEVKELFRTRNLKEWSDFSMQVDCCLTPILEIGELKNHQYILEKKLFSTNITAPTIGEDNDEILKKVLNKSDEEILQLQKKGVI